MMPKMASRTFDRKGNLMHHGIFVVWKDDSPRARVHAAWTVEYVGDEFFASARTTCRGGKAKIRVIADFGGMRENKRVDCKLCITRLLRRAKEIAALAGVEIRWL